MPAARPFLEVAGEAKSVHEELDNVIKSIHGYAPEFLRETVITKQDIQNLPDDEATAYILFNATEFGTAIILLVGSTESLVMETFHIEKFTSDDLKEMVKAWYYNLEKIRKKERIA